MARPPGAGSAWGNKAPSVIGGALLLGVGAVVWHLQPAPVADAESFLADFVRSQGLVGGVLAYGSADEAPQLLAIGHADPLRQQPLQVGQRLKLASLSKPITAAAVFALVAQNRLALDDRLVDLLNVPAATARSLAGITVRHLLQHSGGWDRAEQGDPFFVTAAAPTQQAGYAQPLHSCADVVQASAASPSFIPGTRYAYSNIGYCWLGQIITARTGLPYADAVYALVPEVASMHLETAALDVTAPIPPSQRDLLVNEPALIGPAGGWIASAPDYYAFAARPIHPAIMQRPDYAPEGQFYGLGWRVWPDAGSTVLSHFGAMPGYFSVVLRGSDDRLLVALFIGRPGDDEAALRQWLRWFRQAGAAPD